MADDWKVRISGYLDGELSAAEREAFEQQVERGHRSLRSLACASSPEAAEGRRSAAGVGPTDGSRWDPARRALAVLGR